MELDAMKIQCGVYNRYYYADLVGEDARRLTTPENALKLWQLVENDEVIFSQNILRDVATLF